MGADTILDLFVTNLIVPIVGLLVQIIVALLDVVMKVLFWVINLQSDIIHSEAVNIGWPIVRDVFNMVFILALLFIAFTTVLRVSNTQWNKFLAKLVIMAILINFSRTICGLIIDFGNVIMYTFAKSLGDIQGSGFLSLMNVDRLMNYASASGGGRTALDGLFVAIVSVAIAAVALVVVTVITIVLVWRMVFLWILVIISPLAYALRALPSSKAEGYASRWWSEFTSAVAVGPFLIFFLWLSISSLQSFKLQQEAKLNSEGNPGLDTAEVIKLDSFGPFLVSVLMLIAGLQLAGELGGMAGGFAGKMSQKGLGQLKQAYQATGGKVVQRTKGAVVGAGKAAAGGIALATSAAVGAGLKRGGRLVSDRTQLGKAETAVQKAQKDLRKAQRGGNVREIAEAETALSEKQLTRTTAFKESKAGARAMNLVRTAVGERAEKKREARAEKFQGAMGKLGLGKQTMSAMEALSEKSKAFSAATFITPGAQKAMHTVSTEKAEEKRDAINRSKRTINYQKAVASGDEASMQKHIEEMQKDGMVEENGMLRKEYIPILNNLASRGRDGKTILDGVKSGMKDAEQVKFDRSMTQAFQKVSDNKFDLGHDYNVNDIMEENIHDLGYTDVMAGRGTTLSTEGQFKQAAETQQMLIENGGDTEQLMADPEFQKAVNNGTALNIDDYQAYQQQQIVSQGPAINGISAEDPGEGDDLTVSVNFNDLASAGAIDPKIQVGNATALRTGQVDDKLKQALFSMIDKQTGALEKALDKGDQNSMLAAYEQNTGQAIRKMVENFNKMKRVNEDPKAQRKFLEKNSQELGISPAIDLKSLNINQINSLFNSKQSELSRAIDSDQVAKEYQERGTVNSGALRSKLSEQKSGLEKTKERINNIKTGDRMIMLNKASTNVPTENALAHEQVHIAVDDMGKKDLDSIKSELEKASVKPEDYGCDTGGENERIKEFLTRLFRQEIPTSRLGESNKDLARDLSKRVAVLVEKRYSSAGSSTMNNLTTRAINLNQQKVSAINEAYIRPEDSGETT